VTGQDISQVHKFWEGGREVNATEKAIVGKRKRKWGDEFQRTHLPVEGEKEDDNNW